MKQFILGLMPFMAVWCTVTAQDLRPAFDKSAYRGTLWTQVNPWWPPNKPRSSVALGGANFARRIYSEAPEEYWLEAMRECQSRGMTGWQFELTASSPGFAEILKQVIRAAEKSDGFKLGLMLGLYRPEGGLEEAWTQLQTQMNYFKDEWKNSPAFYRLDDRPVIMLFTPFDYSPEECGELISRFEAEFGPAIWLANIWWGTYDVASKPNQLRRYMPYFDGISAYANWGDERELYQVVGEIMHNEFPGKIFEASVHNTYSVHYFHSGVLTEAAKKYIASWESMQESRPDAVVMTNLFDHWENSLILPCYEREDLMLRYAEYQMSELFGQRPFEASTSPELVLTNYIDLMPGWRPLRFEVIAFPIDSKHQEMSFALEICNSAGELLHRFPEEQVVLDQLRVFSYELPTEQFAGERAVIPRLVGTRLGRPWSSAFNPPTIIDPSLRGSLMYWARSTRNALKTADGVTGWTLNGEGPGSTVDWQAARGTGFFAAQILPDGQSVKQVRIIRNGDEWQSWAQDALALGRALALPDPGENLDYYWLEMETAAGNRFQTLPIWVSSGRRPGMVPLRYRTADRGTLSCEVESARVPAFVYPCDYDSGMMLVDVGGRRHNGKRNQHTAGYPYGSLAHTGYGHGVDGNVPDGPNPLFQRDADGNGFLHFEAAGEYYYLLAGGSAFPFSGSYELEVRPGAPGTKRGIIGTVNGQIQLWLDEQGYLKAQRGGSAEGMAGTQAANAVNAELTSRLPLAPGQWHRVAATYDAENFKLYVDGELQESAALLPNPDHVVLNHLSVGSLLGFLHDAHTYFDGDIRRIRFTGRALNPEELAK